MFGEKLIYEVYFIRLRVEKEENSQEMAVIRLGQVQTMSIKGQLIDR